MGRHPHRSPSETPVKNSRKSRFKPRAPDNPEKVSKMNHLHRGGLSTKEFFARFQNIWYCRNQETR